MSLLSPASQSVPCLEFLGDYEELLTDIQSCRKLKRGRRREALPELTGVACWILEFSRCSRDVRVLLHVQVGQCYFQRANSPQRRTLVGICRAFRSSHFIGLQSTSDRTELGEDSPVYTTKADKFRVYRFPWRQGSLFPSKHSGIAIAIRETPSCQPTSDAGRMERRHSWLLFLSVIPGSRLLRGTCLTDCPLLHILKNSFLFFMFFVFLVLVLVGKILKHVSHCQTASYLIH